MNTIQKLLIILKDGKVTGAQAHFSEPFTANVKDKPHNFPAGMAVPIALVADDTLRPQLVAVLGEVTVAAISEKAEAQAAIAELKEYKARVDAAKGAILNAVADPKLDAEATTQAIVVAITEAEKPEAEKQREKDLAQLEALRVKLGVD